MIYCVYHKDDYDGKCSAAIVGYYQKVDNYIPMSYGDSIEWINDFTENDIIYMCDISLPYNEMIRLSKYNLIWLDHHISAIHDSFNYSYNNIKGTRNIKYSGCELTWKWFNNDNEIYNDIVKLLGRYDVWDMSDIELWKDKILPFQNGMVFENYGISELREIIFYYDKIRVNSFVEEVIEIGNIIIKYQSVQDKVAMQNSYEMEYKGFKCIVCNSTRSNSKSFESVWDKNKYDIMVRFCYTKDGKWQFSFYSDKDGIDCSQFAKLIESTGGGHKGAAGCIIYNNPFLK